MSKRTALLLSASIILGLIFTSCDTGETDQISSETEQIETGDLVILANGEDFVRSGFVSSDGWHITFRHVFITITDVTAYQTDPPYDPHTGGDITGSVILELGGVVTIDLAEGDERADPLLVGVLEDMPAGHYNAFSWSMIPSAEGPSTGYSIYIDAQAEKGDQSYNVLLGFEDSYLYCAGEYVGDERKGFVTADAPGDLEMTFHFDHIFGDSEQPLDSELNMMAIGFEPFAELMQEGTVEEDLASLSVAFSEETYAKLQEALSTLGHTGEGHCNCTVIR